MLSVTAWMVLAVIPWVYASTWVGGLLTIGGSCVLVTYFGVRFQLMAKSTFEATPVLEAIPHLELAIPPSGAEQGLAFVHASDIHVTRGANSFVFEGRKGGGEAALTSLINLVELAEPYFLFVTGDATDTGHSEEWRKVRTLLGALASRRRPNPTAVFLAPGNHDISPVYVHDADDYEAEFGKFWRYLRVFSRLNPSVRAADGRSLSTIVVDARKVPESDIRVLAEPLLAHDNDRHRPVSLLADYSGRRRRPDSIPRRFRWLAVQELRGRQACGGDEQSLFPLLQEHAHVGSIVCVLHSVPPHSTLGESALGAFGSEQLVRLERALLESASKDLKHLFILMHHAPFRWWGETFEGVEAWKNYALLSHLPEETQQLTKILQNWTEQPRRHAVILCGHRHEQFCGALSAVDRCRVLSAESLVSDGTRLKRPWIGRWAEDGTIEVGTWQMHVGC